MNETIAPITLSLAFTCLLRANTKRIMKKHMNSDSVSIAAIMKLEVGHKGFHNNLIVCNLQRFQEQNLKYKTEIKRQNCKL